MNCGDEREYTCFIKWTYPPDIRVRAPMLCWMFYPVRSGKRDATSKPTRALNSKADVPHLLMLAHVAHEIVGTGLALEFKSARDTTIETQDEWLRHLNDEEWIILVVRSAEEARVALMRNLDKGLPSL